MTGAICPQNGMIRPHSGDEHDDAELAKMWAQLVAGEGLGAAQMIQVFAIGQAVGRTSYAIAVERLAKQLGECAPSWPPMPAGAQ